MIKQINWRTELPSLLIFIFPWAVYAFLYNSLPDKIPSHYTTTADGWVADATMPPFNMLLVLSMVQFLIYGAISIGPLVQKDSMNYTFLTILYYFKLAILLLIAGTTAYMLLSAVGKLPDAGDDDVMNITMLLIFAVINAFIYALFRMMKKAVKPPVSAKHHNIIWIGVHVVASAGPLISIMASYGFYLQRLVPQMLLLFLAICGNLLYNAKPNLFMGIRTPWTLKSEDVWRKTHHVGGVFLFICGIIAFIVSIFAPEHWLQPLVLVTTLVPAIFSCIYSFVIYKKGHEQ